VVEQVRLACRTEGAPEKVKPTMPKSAMVPLRVSGFEFVRERKKSFQVRMERERENEGFSGFVVESRREGNCSNNAKREEREWSV